jgi:hypothetical protein
MTAIVYIPTGEVRRARQDDWVLTPRGEFILWFWNKSETEYPIFTRHEIRAEVAQRMMEEVNNAT